MIQFMFKVGDQQRELSSINDAALRASFEDLTTTLTRELGSFTCKEHHRGPMITLQAKGSQAVVAGFGSCCEELAVRVKTSLLALGVPANDWVTMTSTKRFTM